MALLNRKMLVLIFVVQLVAAVICTTLFLRCGIDLRFDRALVIDGDWWRVVTAPFTHLNEAHLGLNFAAYAALLVLFAKELTARGLLILTFSSLVLTGAALTIWPGDAEWYIGFSGVLHSLFAFGSLRAMRSQPWFSVAFVLMVSKIGLELAHVRTFDQNIPIAATAHAWGAAFGALWLVVYEIHNFVVITRSRA